MISMKWFLASTWGRKCGLKTCPCGDLIVGKSLLCILLINLILWISIRTFLHLVMLFPEQVIVGAWHRILFKVCSEFCFRSGNSSFQHYHVTGGDGCVVGTYTFVQIHTQLYTFCHHHCSCFWVDWCQSCLSHLESWQGRLSCITGCFLWSIFCLCRNWAPYCCKYYIL